ncbi:polymeric immunoglobulin receptor-like isoform 2-T2 [Odontesthes bonariensis]|uniref:polymeric immunoglobulin receptor-like isoform X2 n=1 Tax=Odontesthes bonariensis TaxID=219752 RepID=UPI003F58EE1C
MALPLSILLILTGTTGIHSITTAGKVSVKAGASISIPCLYSSQYRDHVKYLCEGYYWSSCSYATKTNQPQSSEKFSISDDKKQNIFTVTIKHLTDRNTYYWCAVEIDGGSDVRQYFQLFVISGEPRVKVAHQEVTGYIGENITINCQFTDPGKLKWCRLGMTCVTEKSGLLDGTNVSIKSDSDVFKVTMSGLRPETAGWYWCVKGDFQMPVHLTVTEKPNATVAPVPTDGKVTTVKDEQNSASFDPMSLVIPLSLLILAVAVALVLWFILRCKKAKSGSVVPKEEISRAESDTDVTYSSLVISTQQKGKGGEAKEDDVTYSTLTFPHQRST